MERRAVIRIRKNSVIVFALLFLSINWEILEWKGSGTIQLAENVLRVFAAGCATLLYLKRKKGRLSPVFLLLIFMDSWLLISTAVNRGSLYGCIFGYLFPLVATGLLFESMSEKLDDLITGCMSLAEVLCYSNFISILLYPDGMYSTYRTSWIWWSNLNWLLGNRNDFIPYFLFFCLIAYLYRCHGGKLWREWCLYIVCLLSVLLVNSSTSIVGLSVLLLLFIVIKTRKIHFNIYLLIATNISLFFAIVIFRLQDVFSFLIEDLLGKSLTFTGRTGLWDKIIPLIQSNLLWGMGIQESGGLQHIVGINFAGQAHNLILNLFYRGGVVYFSLYCAMLVVICRQLHKMQRYAETQGAIATLFVFQIIAMMESYEKTFFVNLLYFLIYYATLLPRNILTGQKNHEPE